MKELFVAYVGMTWPARLVPLFCEQSEDLF